MNIAYFLTFRCYGTWLHGDERGSVDRENNAFGEEFVAAHGALKRYRHKVMNAAPQGLNAARRVGVAEAIEEVALHRG